MAALLVPPPLLWHYKTFDGLHGIITEGEFVASSLAYLNDTEEFLYTINPLLKHIDAQGVPLNDLMRGLYFDSVTSMVKAMFAHIRGQQHFVTCFSKEPDDLSQWRSYAPRPPGFAIGFAPDMLQSLAGSLGFDLLECTYPSPDNLLTEVIATFESATAGMKEEKEKLPMSASSEAIGKFTDKWSLEVVAAIIGLAPKNKHPKVAAEKEVRLHGIIPPVNAKARFPVKHRLSGSLVVPYIKIPARLHEGPFPIKVILVGPCPHQDVVIAVTRRMCVQHEVRPQ